MTLAVRLSSLKAQPSQNLILLFYGEALIPRYLAQLSYFMGAQAKVAYLLPLHWQPPR